MSEPQEQIQSGQEGQEQVAPQSTTNEDTTQGATVPRGLPGAGARTRAGTGTPELGQDALPSPTGPGGAGGA